MNTDKNEQVEASYENLLDATGKVSPELVDRLRAKYEADRQDFVQAVEDFVPSKEPKYWAKRSCSKCYGQGIIGKKHVFMPGQSAYSALVDGEKMYSNSMVQQDVRCACSAKGYRAWLTEFRTFFNALKQQTEAWEAEQVEEEGETEDAT